MSLKRVLCVLVTGVLVCSFSMPVFCEGKKEAMEQLSQAKKDFITQRDKLHDQDRTLRIAWHKERADLYAQLKASPKDKALMEQLNAGAKKFLADKKEVYQKLEQLRKAWLQTRKDLGASIKSVQ
ncbi:MAG: hypothetical protein WCI77_09235 [Candidatus Omnitrophota bacterium]